MKKICDYFLFQITIYQQKLWGKYFSIIGDLIPIILATFYLHLLFLYGLLNLFLFYLFPHDKTLSVFISSIVLTIVFYFKCLHKKDITKYNFSYNIKFIIALWIYFFILILAIGWVGIKTKLIHN